MSYMSEWIYSEEELREVVKEDREFIREEIRQAIENGVIKIETGSEKLFEINQKQILFCNIVMIIILACKM